MKRRGKERQVDSQILKDMKRFAIATAEELLRLRCAASKTQPCDCRKNRAELLLEIVMKTVAAYPSRPINLIGLLYEHLLLYEIIPNPKSDCTIQIHSKNSKRAGSFYTPPELANFAVEKALSSLVYEKSGQLRSAEEILSLKVIDPAMGCALFLSAALEYLAEKLMESESESESESRSESQSDIVAPPDIVSYRRRVAGSCIYGVDLDSGAVEVGKFIIASQCDDLSTEFREHLATRLKAGNSLVGSLPDCELDASTQSECDRLCSGFFVHTQDSQSSGFPFFHWKIEFPEIFSGPNPGFDAVLGNPPWEIQKPNSREFFQKKDKNHFALSKQDALQKQLELRSDTVIDAEWLTYQRELSAFSRWVAESGNFKLQGSSDLNAYKLFIELSLAIAKSGGLVSLIVPSSIYSDKGTFALRNEFIRCHKWLYLYGFDNSGGFFSIHRSFKFCIFGLEKHGETNTVQTLFHVKNVDALRNAEPLNLSMENLNKFSPNWLSMPEIESRKDLQLLEKIADRSISLGEFANQHVVKFKREFDMTNDSHLFVQRDQAESQGYIADEHGRWILGTWTDSQAADGERIFSAHGALSIAVNDIDDIALPLYEGRMIGQFDVAQKGWVRGKGRQAVWLPVPDGRILPQYLVRAQDYLSETSELKVGFLGVGSATNARSMIAAVMGPYPCGNSVPTFSSADPEIVVLLCACLNSFVFDYILRNRLVGNNLNYFILQECFLPRIERLAPHVVEIAARLSWNHHHYSPVLRQMLSRFGAFDPVLRDERRHLRIMLDALIAHAYGLDLDDMRHILRQCERSQLGAGKGLAGVGSVKGSGEVGGSMKLAELGSGKGSAEAGSFIDLLEPIDSEDLYADRSDHQVNSASSLPLSAKGFWRVDKNLPASQRQTQQTLKAFECLQRVGMSNFVAQSLSFNLSS